MSQKFFILVEGTADIVFLKDYLISLNNSFEIDKLKGNELELLSENRKITIQATNGYTQINNRKTTIDKRVDAGYKILVIQDADDPTKNHGGKTNRLAYLEQIKSTLSITFETFLFPNNQDDGDLETLLLIIKNEKQFMIADTCYNNFHKEEYNNGGKFAHELLETKNRVYNYFRTYYGIENAKEINRKFEKTHWDFNHSYLKPLKDFFEKNNLI